MSRKRIAHDQSHMVLWKSKKVESVPNETPFHLVISFIKINFYCHHPTSPFFPRHSESIPAQL